MSGADQCRYCPNDADRDEAGFLHCIECGWTDNPGKVVGLHETIDSLRGDLAETRDRRDYLQGQLDLIYDAEYSRNDALTRRIEKLTAELADLRTAGDAIADYATQLLISLSGVPEVGSPRSLLSAWVDRWRSVRADGDTR